MAILERRRIKSSEGWPQEADEHYERIRHLGQGSSGSVWMAREKTRKGTGGFRTCTNGGKMVAIKRIHLKSARMEAYAEREISILSKINHPNLIRLERCFDYCAVSETQTIAMSLAHGPNLLNLIDKGGALGIPCSRLISRHLVAAVSYLHVRAVTHRDLKPSNCVLVGANHNDKAIWSDDDHAVKKVASGAWKLVLVDFGFARAISEDDISLHDPNLPPHMRFRYRSLSQLQMRMSAVGTDSYIAPEMFNGIHQKEYETECIAPCVSDYGLQVDAYALGTTLLEVMSGVPSGEDINSFIEKTAQKKKSTQMKKVVLEFLRKKQKKSFRSLQTIPMEALDLIHGLTRSSPTKRTTVREAQIYPWISGGKRNSSIFDLPQGDVPSKIGDEVIFL